MFGSDVPILQLAAFLIGKRENSLGFRREMKFGGLRNALAQNDAFFDFAPDGFDRQRVPERENLAEMVLSSRIKPRRICSGEMTCEPYCKSSRPNIFFSV